MIIISESLSILSASIIFIIFFASVLAYMMMSGSSENTFYQQLKKAKRLIEEGHARALKGSRNDGFFEEVRREKYKEEYDKCMEKARNTADQDISLLS